LKGGEDIQATWKLSSEGFSSPQARWREGGAEGNRQDRKSGVTAENNVRAHLKNVDVKLKRMKRETR